MVPSSCGWPLAEFQLIGRSEPPHLVARFTLEFVTGGAVDRCGAGGLVTSHHRPLKLLVQQAEQFGRGALFHR